MKKELLILLINKWWISVEPETSFTPVTLLREITENISLSLFTKFFLERARLAGDGGEELGKGRGLAEGEA